MSRSAASIQAEIDTLETYLQSTASLIGSVGSDGTTLTRAQRSSMSERLDELYQQLGRADGSSPMIVRGVVKGLR